MKRMIILKTESKDGQSQEVKISLNKVQYTKILWAMQDNNAFKKSIGYNIIVSSDDEILVGVVLSEYEHNVPNSVLKKLLEKFPKSEQLQIHMVTYCMANHKPDMLHYFLNHGLTYKIKKEAKEALKNIL